LPFIEAKKLAVMSNTDAHAFIAEHLKTIAPYVGVGGAVAYQLLDHLLGQKSKEFKNWLIQQKKLDEYSQIDVPRYMQGRRY